MPRLKHGSLRGSVMQNDPRRGRAKPRGFFFKIRVGFVVLTLGFAAVTLLWAWSNGWASKQARRLTESSIALTQKARFAVKDVIVEGRQYTPKDDIFAALETHAGAPLLVFDPVKAHDRLLKLPWIASATVERRLPDTIYVSLTERKPMARWQNDNVTVVIDNEGKTLANTSPERFVDLPLVAGDGAPEQTATLLNSLKEFPNIMPRVKGAVRVGGRRWNLHINSGQVVRLPEHKMSEALQRLDRLITEQKILDRNIAGIDLRLPDRMVFEPKADPNDAESREAKRP